MEIVILVGGAADHGEHLGAASYRRVVILEDQRRRALGDDEAVAVLREGLCRCLRVALAVERAESSEKRTTSSAVTEQSVPTQSAASVSPRRIASMPSWIAVAPDAQAVVSDTGEPLVPKRSASFSET